MGAWKSWSSKGAHDVLRPRPATAATTPLWQREFFDHLLRSNESYSEKWNYVFENPVRAGLVTRADDWPYAGEIETLMLSRRSLTAEFRAASLLAGVSDPSYNEVLAQLRDFLRRDF